MKTVEMKKRGLLSRNFSLFSIQALENVHNSFLFKRISKEYVLLRRNIFYPWETFSMMSMKTVLK